MHVHGAEIKVQDQNNADLLFSLYPKGHCEADILCGGVIKVLIDAVRHK